MKKRLRIIFPIVLIAAGVGLYFSLQGNADKDGALVVFGSIEADETVLSFRTPGRLRVRYAEEGRRTAKGEILAELESEDQVLQVAAARAEAEYAEAVVEELLNGSRIQEISAARASLEQARAGRASARARMEQARADFLRFKDLHEQDVVSEREYEAHRTALETARAAYEQSAAAVDAALEKLDLVEEGPRAENIRQSEAKAKMVREHLRQAERQLEYTKLKSPVAGVILTESAEAGEYVNPGTPVLTVADLSTVRMRAYVNETDLPRIKRGGKATITVDGVPDATFPGHIRYISDEAEFSPKSVQTREERVKLMYRIEIELENPENLLKPGMPAEAELEEG